jgi:hypothetical protein
MERNDRDRLIGQVTSNGLHNSGSNLPRSHSTMSRAWKQVSFVLNSPLSEPPIGPNDLQIAAIARANGLTLVTHNVAEFGRVPGLLVEDWQVP